MNPIHHEPLADPATIAATEGPDLRHVFDRAYRELVEERAQADLLRTLCRGMADELDLPLVLLVRRSEDGVLEPQATSRQSALWVELMQLPERTDGTLAGYGPAARALHAGEPVLMTVADEGFLPWRRAARRDGIVTSCAWPLGSVQGGWVLLLYDHHVGDVLERLTGEAAAIAAAGCARLVDACARSARQQLLACAMERAGNPSFIADSQGRVVWSNRAFARMSGYRDEEMRGRMPRFLSAERRGVDHYRELWNTIRAGRVWHGQTVDRDRTGTAYSAVQTISPFGVGATATHYLAVYEDVIHPGDAQGGREPPSAQDPVTGLLRRSWLEQAVGDAAARGEPAQIALVMLRTGDALDALGAGVRELLQAECHARVRRIAGGDRSALRAPGEYLVWLPDDADSAEEIAEALHDSLLEAGSLAGESPLVDLRIGRAQAPVGGTSLEALLAEARRALMPNPPLAACRSRVDSVH